MWIVTWIGCEPVPHVSQQQLQDFILVRLTHQRVLLKVDLQSQIIPSYDYFVRIIVCARQGYSAGMQAYVFCSMIQTTTMQQVIKFLAVTQGRNTVCMFCLLILLALFEFNINHCHLQSTNRSIAMRTTLLLMAMKGCTLNFHACHGSVRCCSEYIITQGYQIGSQHR